MLNNKLKMKNKTMVWVGIYALIAAIILIGISEVLIIKNLSSNKLLFLLPAMALAIVALLVLFMSIKTSKALEKETENNKYQKKRFDIIYENTSVSVWDYDFQTKEIRQTDKSVNMHGHQHIVPNVPEGLVKSKYVHPDSADAFMEMYNKLYAGEKKAEGIFKVKNADRTAYWYEYIRYTTLFSKDGSPYGAIGISTDVTEQEKRSQIINQLTTLVSGMPYESTTIYEYNLSENKFVRMQGTLIPKTCEKNYNDFNGCVKTFVSKVVHPEDANKIEKFLDHDKLISEYINDKCELSMEYRAKLQGGYTWIKLTVKLFVYPDGESIHAIIISADINEKKEKELSLVSQAENDSLTGVLNRQSFEKKVEEVFALYPKSLHVLIMIDIDNFKKINDTLGHLAGDRELEKIVSLIRSVMRREDIIGRVGGDEFMVLLKDIPGVDIVSQRVEIINKMLYERINDELTVSASLGIALFPKDGVSFRQLYKSADIAVYNSKETGKNKYTFFTNKLIESKKSVVSLIDGPDADVLDNSRNEEQVTQLLLENRNLLEREDENERYRIIIEKTGIVSFEWNEATRKFYASEGFDEFEMAKQKKSNIFSENADFEAVHPNDRTIYYGKFLEKVLSGESAPEITLRLKTITGEYKWCRLSAIVISNEENDAIKYIGIITAAEFESKSSEMQLRLILKFMIAGVLLVEICGERVVPIFVSESYYRMDDVHANPKFMEDVLGFVYPDDALELKSKIQIAVQNGEILNHKFRVVRQNGIEWRKIQAVRIPYSERENPVMIVVESKSLGKN